ncbi:MAG: hypothetical protein IKB09_03820 [Oscillospiraceae bacterium]|nr:hypothetical protein [Oscillospiraceae bacterium]
MKRLLSWILVLTLLFSLTACSKKEQDGNQTVSIEQQKAVLADTIDQTGEFLHSSVADPTFGSVGGEWLIMGLARSGLEISDEYYEIYFQNLCAYSAQQGGVLHAKKYTEYSRVILAVTAIGRDPADVGGFNMLQPLADFEQTVFQGINGPIFALLALDSGNYEIPENTVGSTQATRDLYVDYIINAQLENGGWSLMGGEAEIDVTAMALQALAKYQDRKDVAEAVEKGLAVLSERQNDQGGYQYNAAESVSSESVSQVIVALAELGIALDDSRFVKNGNTLLDALMQFQQEDGGFAHLMDGETDLLATEQAFYALVAANRVAQGESSLYLMK